MPLLLVGVHRAAEDEDRSVLLRRSRRRRARGRRPLDEPMPSPAYRLREDALADVAAVHDRQDFQLRDGYVLGFEQLT